LVFADESRRYSTYRHYVINSFPRLLAEVSIPSCPNCPELGAEKTKRPWLPREPMEKAAPRHKTTRARLDRARMEHAATVRDDDGTTVQISEEAVSPKPLQLMGVAGNCGPVMDGEEKRPLPDSNRGWRICN